VSTDKRRARKNPRPTASGGGGAGLRPAGAAPGHGSETAYDRIAGLYDDWSRSVTEDIGFYVAEARRAGGPVVELGVGTGRIAVPIAQAGVPVIGVDASRGMLEVCGRRAEAKGVGHLVDLRQGDIRRPPVHECVQLVIAPFRSLLHLEDDGDRFESLAAIHELLEPGGRFVFDVFAPSGADIEETHGRWLEREPGIWERAEWDEDDRVLTLLVRGNGAETSMQLNWLPPERWRELLELAGFERPECYGWFDRRPFSGGEDSVWIAHRP
jgi:SAM-dependent methyltransferase